MKIEGVNSSMTPESLRLALAGLGLDAVDFARLLDVTDRVVRMWLSGKHGAKAVPVPRYAEIIVSLMAKHPKARRELIACYLDKPPLTSPRDVQGRFAKRERVAVAEDENHRPEEHAGRSCFPG